MRVRDIVDRQYQPGTFCAHYADDCICPYCSRISGPGDLRSGCPITALLAFFAGFHIAGRG
jgi:hypothetical protein